MNADAERQERIAREAEQRETDWERRANLDVRHAPAPDPLPSNGHPEVVGWESYVHPLGATCQRPVFASEEGT